MKVDQEKIRIDQFTVKNLGFKTPAAYELESNLVFSVSEKDSDKMAEISLDALLIGQFFLKDFFKNGIMESRAHLKISNVSSPYFSHFFQKGESIKSDMNLKLNRNGELQGRIDSNFAKSTAKLNFSVEQSKIHLSDVEIKLLINEFLNNSDIFLNSSESFFSMKGNLVIEDGKLYPQLSFATDSEVSLNFEKEKFIAEIEGSLVKNDFSSEAKIKFLDGKGRINLAGEIDFNSQKPFHEKVKNYNCKIDLSEMKFKTPFIQKLFYGQNNRGEKKNSSSHKKIVLAKKEKVSENLFLLPKGLVSLRWRNLEIGGQDFNGLGKWQTHLNRVEASSVNFQYDAGKGSFPHSVIMHKDNIESKFNLKVKNLNLIGLTGLLPRSIPKIQGNLGGESRGTVSIGKLFKHDININLNVLKGNFKEADIRPYTQKILNVVARVPALKNKVDSGKAIGLNGDFEKIHLKGRFRQNHYLLSEFIFQGIKNRFQIRARGDVYPNKNRVGSIYVDLKETKIISPQLKKQTQTETLPMLFKGPKLSLAPDYSYSLKKLAKSHLQKRKRKLVKDSKEKAKNKLEDLLKGEGEKILKKFF